MPEAVTEAFRQEWGRIVAALIGTTGDWDLAGECAQEAFAQALKSWLRDGVPRRPGAWLTTVARRRALDRLRRGAAESAKLREVAALSAGQEPDSGDDARSYREAFALATTDAERRCLARRLADAENQA